MPRYSEPRSFASSLHPTTGVAQQFTHLSSTTCADCAWTVGIGATCKHDAWEHSPMWTQGQRCSPMCMSERRAASGRAEWSTPDAKHSLPVAGSLPAYESQWTTEKSRRRSALVPEGRLSRPTVIEATCALLDRMVQECHGYSTTGRIAAPIFHSLYVPSVSASDYLVAYLVRMGLTKKDDLVDTVVLYTLCLVDRLLQMQSANGVHLCESNVHRILLTAMLLACKVLDDDLYNNRYWAAVGGVPLEHLNTLESHMVQLLDFRLLVTAHTLETVRLRLVQPC